MTANAKSVAQEHNSHLQNAKDETHKLSFKADIKSNTNTLRTTALSTADKDKLKEETQKLKDERLKEDRNLKGIKALIKSLGKDIKEADKKIVAIDNDILTIDARLIAIANNLGIISANIPNLEAEL